MKFFNRFKTILLVEDDEQLRRAISDKLADEGFRVREARDGEAGLMTALKEQPDLILLDLMLPKRDGISVLEELRRDSWGQRAKVFIITVLNETDERRARAKTLHALEYIDKSNYQIEDVVQKVREAFRR